MYLIRFAIGNPLIANLLLALVVISGILSWNAMPQEMFPVFELDRVRITTTYAGASPVEIERQVTLPIEEEFDGMADIDVISSISREGVSTITVKLKPDTNIENFMRNSRTALDRIKDLPELAEEPELKRMESRFPVITLALYGDASKSYLYKVSNDVKRQLLAIPGVASANIAGKRDWEIWVTVNPAHLATYRVSLDEVILALQLNLKDLPGGSIKAEEGDILLRGKGLSPDLENMSNIVVRTNSQGGKLLLSTIAKLEYHLEEANTLGRFNGKPSVNITVTKTASSSTIAISEKVRQLADELSASLPASIQVGVFSDVSIYVKTRLETVKSSGLIGLFLVLLALYLFLNFRVALITALGIPISFLFAITVIYYLGYSINMVSLFAFLIALGMIVDDAIIVTENIYRHMENGVPPEEAATIGAREVFWPVVASTLTTIAAFLPMFAIGGTMGAFIAVIPVVVSACLIGSLFEAYGVLPSHAALLLRVNKKKPTRWVNWKTLLAPYIKFLHWAILSRYFVAIAVSGCLAIVLMFAYTRLPFTLFGNVETGQFFINVEAPSTYSLEDSGRLAQRLEKEIMATLTDTELNTLLSNIGITFINFNTVKFGNSYIQFIVDLKKREPQGFIENWITPLVSFKFGQQGQRVRATDDIINQLREQLTSVAGVQRLYILRPQGGPTGSDIEIGITGSDIGVLQRHGTDISAYLNQLPGLLDVRQDIETGKLEYQYVLNERGLQLGLTQQLLATNIRSGFQGIKALHTNMANQRLPVRVIYDEKTRHSADIKKLLITLPNGDSVFFGDVADITPGRSANVIKRRNMSRMVIVSAEVDAALTTPLEVVELVKKQFAPLLEQDSDYKVLFLGEKKEANESIKDMTRALIIALAIIFFILAALFRSLLDPLVVLFAIPFGIIGVIIGHWITGNTLQFLSLIGFLALSGIVVNDSLILVDFIKRLRKQGWDRIEAVLEAGRVRARPIILTSITTFLGVSPLIFFSTGQTAFLAPMAVSLGFGLLFATILILVALPCFYLIADDARTGVIQLIKRYGTKRISAH